MRPDLPVERQRFGGRAWWVVKDPLGLNYFRFREEEFAVLEMLDGATSIDEIRAAFERRFAPQRITAGEIQAFVSRLHTSGLVIADLPGQGEALYERRQLRRRERTLATVANLLAIRFRGFDPDRFLTWLDRHLGWIFSAWFTAVCLALVAGAVGLVTVEFDVVRSRLPDWHEFFQGSNLIWLAVALGMTKVLHELGHGLACKHFGAECHEMGVMLLALVPCLYCNVSDAWLLPNKWHRVAIAAAGICVELVLASLATLVWWSTGPGLVNQLCLSIMVLSSVNTVLLNGNPLLRYDGYFILASALESPNLAHRSRAWITTTLARACLGIRLPHERILPERHRGWFVFYTLASLAYRWFVLVMLLWFLSQLFRPYDLPLVGLAIVALVVMGMVAGATWQMARFFNVPGRMGQVKRPRVAMTVGVVGLLALALAFVPLPTRVYAPVTIEPSDSARVYVIVPGAIDEALVRPGDTVSEGATLATLTNRELEQEIEEVAGQLAVQEVTLANLQRQRVSDPSAAKQIPTVTQAIADFTQRRARLVEQRNRLKLVAPRAGVVLPPAKRSAERGSRDRLASWSGTPLEKINRGAWLEAGTLLCLVGDREKLEAVLVIDQADVGQVSAGQEVEIQLDELPSQTFSGRIAETAEIDLKRAPEQLSVKTGGELQTASDRRGGERPASASYQARVPLDDPNGLMLLDARGRAKIHVSSQAIGPRLWRYFAGLLRTR
jgi:putative peptide zinc metalloprotease protein